MTNEIDAAHSDNEPEKEKINPLDQPEGTDWFLAWIINHAEIFGVEQSITLSVGGSLVTGMVTSGRKYFEGIADAMLESASSEESYPEIASLLSKSYGQWKEVYPETNSGLEMGSQKPKYIHLKNVKTFVGTAMVPTTDGCFWRGKLSSVDGFTIGTMSAS